MKITEAERVVKEALGADWSVTKINRYWLIYRPDRTKAAQHTHLDKAIEQARAAQ